MEDGYGEAGWYPDPKVQWLSNHYNVHPMHIINRSRKALNLPKLPENRDELNRWNKLKRSTQKKLSSGYLSGTDTGVCTTRMREQGGHYVEIDKNGRNVNIWQVCNKKTLKQLDDAAEKEGIPKELLKSAMFLNETDIGKNFDNHLKDSSILNASLYATGDTFETRQMALNNSMFSTITNKKRQI